MLICYSRGYLISLLTRRGPHRSIGQIGLKPEPRIERKSDYVKGSLIRCSENKYIEENVNSVCEFRCPTIDTLDAAP